MTSDNAGWAVVPRWPLAGGADRGAPGGWLAALTQLAAKVAKRPDRLLGGLEQLLTSLFSMLGFIVLSRLLDVAAFGTIAAAISIALLVQLVHDSLTVSPLVVDCPHPREDRSAFGEWLIWHFLVAGVLSLGLLVAGWLVAPVQPLFGHELKLAAPILLGGSLFSFTRRMHYHWATFGPLLLQTVLYGGLYAVGLALLWSSGMLTPETATIAVALAFGLPGLIFTFRDCREARFDWNLLPHVQRARGLVASMGATGLVWQSSYAAALISLTWLSTPVAVAIFVVTRTLERPIALLISTVLDVDTSQASRAMSERGVAGLTAVVSSVRLILVGITALPIALMVLFPEVLLSLIYGEKYAYATLELQLRILVLVPLVVAAPLHLGLTVLRDTGYLLRVTLLGFLAGVAFLVVCTLFGELNAATANASLILMQLVTVPFLYVRYTAKLREAAGGPT